MDILVDTSVLVAGTIKAHPKYTKANAWLIKAVKNKINMVVCSHSIAEYYSVVTRLPLSPRITPALALHMIENNIEANVKLVHLTSKDVLEAVTDLANNGLPGGIVYDRLIFQAARKAKVKHILTFNTKDFQRFCMDQPNFIMEP